ncbi:MAG: ABC transporter ATP-binding protein [Chloroflexota bacterium]
MASITRVEPRTGSHLACRIRDLTVAYRVGGKDLPAVRAVDLDIASGAITAVIGESGSGKTTLAMAMLNAVQPPGRISSGSIEYADLGDVLTMRGRRLQHVRGDAVSMVFQTSQNSLNPLKTVGAQVLDLARSHGRRDRRAVLREGASLLSRMSLDPDRVLSAYQHELSGGMRQRVVLMLALVLEPTVVLLDEPTTALDVLSQSEVLEILRTLQNERGFSAVLITHDMGVVAELADRVAVMYAGRVVETGQTADILMHSQHPYTRALIQSIPRLTGPITAVRPLPGLPPSLATIPLHGCVFRDRCRYRMPVCDTEDPALQSTEGNHWFACHLGGKLDDRDS